MPEHFTHHDPAVREIIAREVAAERERIAQAIEDHGAVRRANGYEAAALVYGAAARIARGGAGA